MTSVNQAIALKSQLPALSEHLLQRAIGMKLIAASNQTYLWLNYSPVETSRRRNTAELKSQNPLRFSFRFRVRRKGLGGKRTGGGAVQEPDQLPIFRTHQAGWVLLI